MKIISKSKTNQSAEEQKKEELKDEIRSYLNKYENIKNSEYFTYRQKDILSLMLFRGNGQNEGFTMGYKHIIDIFGYSRSTISATIGMLKDYNFISVEKGHTGVNSKYTLNYDAMKSFKSSSVEFNSENRQDKTSKNRQDKQKQTRQDKTSKWSNKVADNQIDTRVLSNKLDIIIELLKQTLNINNNININLNNLKDNILNNYNTEEYNVKDQNKKKNITKDNLEKLKENSTVEIPNDENLNESRIETKDNISDNEIPSDLPPLNIDDFFESSNDNLIEYRSNDDNISDELEFSIFGNDIISDNENLNNDTTVKFIDGKFQVVEQDKNKINLNLNNMDNSSNTISDNENLNNENNISFEKDNSKVESSKDNYEIWGKLQPVFEKTSNKLVEYLFTEYENLNDSKNVSDGYHQVKQYISIDKDQIKVSVNQTGSFGILSFKDNVYSFIPCNSNIISDSSDTISEHYNITQSCAAETAETSNNALQAVKMSQVDNYTTDTEKIAPVQPKTANKAYTNPDPNNPKVWEYIKLHLTMKQGSHLMRDVLDEYKEIEAKNIHSVIAYMEDMCKAVRSALEKGLINEMQFNDFKRVFQTLSKGKYNYWRKVFSTRSPKSLMSSEMKMWGILGKPKVVNVDDETNKVDNNKNYEDNVILPSEKDFESMSLDEIKNHLLNFVQEHPNLSDDKKAYINNLCVAYTLEPQYVA